MTAAKEIIEIKEIKVKVFQDRGELMKKLILGVLMFSIACLVLTACGKSNHDKLQGTWIAQNQATAEEFGNEMKIEKNNIKSSDHLAYKYFNFKDDKETQINFYDETPQSKYFDKTSPMLETNIEFGDNDTLIIKDDDTTFKYKFMKKK